MSAKNHSSSTPSDKATSVSSEVIAPAVSTPVVSDSNQVRAVRKVPLFAIALAVAGTMPIGLGVGVAYRAKSVESAESSACLAHVEPQVHNEPGSVHWAWRNQQQAEDLFRAGDFRLALQHYQSKENADSLRPSAELALKMALCREALGPGAEALALLEPLAEHAQPDVRTAALVAQSRIHLRRREFTQARATLGQLLGVDPDPDRIFPAISEDAPILLLIACLLDGGEDGDTSDPARPISPLDDALWLRPEILSTESLGTAGILFDEHELLAPQFAEASTEQRRETSERLADRLLARHPTHRLAGHLRLALGEQAYQRGDLANAAARYRDAAEKSPSARSSVAAYNQGVVQFQLREYRPASIALGRFIDGVPGHALCPRALLLRGRALLELGDGELAAFDLKRAADLPGSDEARAWATVYLGMAQLQVHQPKLAAQGMFLRRDRVQGEFARREAGFVVSLARWESLESAESLDRETLFMLRALSKLDPQADWLGACGRMLIGRAYQHLNLIDQAAETFERALANEVQEPFASQMKLALADCLFATGNDAQARKWLTDVQQENRAPWSANAALRLAKWELSQGHHAECLAACRELLHMKVEHAPVLRLMGEAHTLAGNDELAAECFAGLVQSSR